MIYSKFIFPIKQRLFWIKVKNKNKRWKNLITNKKSVVTTTDDQLIFELHKDDLLSEVIYSGSFEWAEKEWLSSILKKGMVFYDIGANVGYYSLLAAKLVSNTGKVYALEPSNQTFTRFNKNIQLNNNFDKIISTYEIAASNTPGFIDIYIANENYQAWNSISEPKNKLDFHTEKIKTNTIDNLNKEYNWRKPDVVKIDVEGWESFVLEGIEGILKKHKPVLLIEFTKEHLNRTSTNYQTLINQLLKFGYDLFEYNPRTKNLENITSWDFDHKNVIAI